MDKLNSIVALSQIVGVDAQAIQLAEEKGELEGIITKFNADNQVYSLSDVGKLKANAENNYIENLKTLKEFPTEVYNTVKGAVLEKFERKLKRTYDFEGDYDDFDSLVDNIIRDNKKQPNESKQEDIQKIKELEEREKNHFKTLDQNELLKNQILSFENEMNNKVSDVESKYQGLILNNQKNRLINNIEFDVNDNETLLELSRKGFADKLSNNIDFSFTEDLQIIGVDKTTKKVLTDKVGNPKNIKNIIEDAVKDFNIPLKTVKTGAGIVSTTASSVNSKESALKYMQENNVTDLNEQMKILQDASK